MKQENAPTKPTTIGMVCSTAMTPAVPDHQLAMKTTTSMPTAEPQKATTSMPTAEPQPVKVPEAKPRVAAKPVLRAQAAKPEAAARPPAEAAPMQMAACPAAMTTTIAMMTGLVRPMGFVYPHVPAQMIVQKIGFAIPGH